MKSKSLIFGLIFALAGLLPRADARSISVNLAVWPTVDQQVVDPGESSVVGVSGAESVDGANWNNIALRGTGSPGPASVFIANTQAGNHINLTSSTGTDSGVDLTSSSAAGGFYANFANVSAPNNTGIGDAALMQGFINLNSSETIALTGLAAWAPDGYKVYAFFDIGPVTRTYAISMTDGSLSQVFWTADTAGIDSDANNDGVIEWLQTTATTSGNAVSDANHAVYGTFTGDTLTISGDALEGARATLSGFQIVALEPPTVGNSLNLNFGITLDDANAVDVDEYSVVGLTGASTVGGSGWNNILLLSSGLGAPTHFTGATQGGNHLNLTDASGADSGIALSSAGAFYANSSNVSAPNQAATGDGGLLQSYLLIDSSESLILTGLGAWAPKGYRVRAFFDIGPFTRTYGITMHDGGAPQTFWTADSAGTDSDPNNDGVISWIPTSATTEATAVADANTAIFGPFTGDTLTVSAASPNGRAVLCGLQITPNTEALATIVSFTATPGSFTTGQSVTLSWEVGDADSVSIDHDIGPVAASGSLNLTPETTTTWTLTATRGGTSITAQATATLGHGPIAVYLLGGQSNMQGTAISSKLPPGLLSIPEVQLYAAGSGVSGSIANQWVALRPANGSTFGPEIGIGERLRDLCPGQPIALIKYATSGTSLELDWRPGANASDTGNWGSSFRGFVNTVTNALASLEAKGWQPVIRGMCWQQGEQDAKDGLNVPESETSADDYGANLAQFIGRIREQFASHAAADGIRFAPGQVLPYAPLGGDVAARFPGRDLVRQAILDADEDSGAPLSVANTRSIPTNSTDHPVHEQDGGSTDEVHLNATAQLALGRSMAYAMLHVDPQAYLPWSAEHSLAGGPDDDDDHDGLSNREEYLLGGDPNDPADTPRPLPEMVEIGGDHFPGFSLTRDLAASSVVPEVQFSLNLFDWTTHSPVFVSSTRQSDSTSTLLFHGPWPIGDPTHDSGFFRIKITGP